MSTADERGTLPVWRTMDKWTRTPGGQWMPSASDRKLLADTARLMAERRRASRA